MNNTPIIQVRDLQVRYNENTILEDVNFDVNEGEIFMIAGGSGCGKTVLLRQLIGLEKPTKGTISIWNEDFTTSRNKKHQEIIRKFGVLFQSSGLIASLTIAENIALILEKFTDLNENRIEEIIELKLGLVGLAGYENYLPSEISGGMKKRAGIARAMALDPAILFLDEPSSGLDPVTAATLDMLIKELNKGLGTTMVVISHDLASINLIGDRIVMLDADKKGIIAQGKPEVLRSDSTNTEVYDFFNRIAN
jgi:phospholipid/cholesterol/gamma-HCH transport system ATP-binding protein